MTSETLPEGTDAVIDTAADDDQSDYSMPDGGPSSDPFVSDGAAIGGDVKAKAEEVADKAGDAAQTLREKLGGTAQDLTSQAGDTLRTYALQGKERAVGGLDDIVRMVDEAAATVDEKVGPQYGDYVRQASGLISGFADRVREKDVDAIFADVRETVQKSPSIAIGATAAIGFVLARIVMAGLDTAKTAANDTKAA